MRALVFTRWLTRLATSHQAIRHDKTHTKDSSEKTRITANTIIRVVADALLGRADELQGDTEGQIRESGTTRAGK